MKVNIQNLFNFEFPNKAKLDLFKNFFFLVSLLYFSFYFLKNFGKISFSINLEKDGIILFLSLLCCTLSVFLNAFAWKNIIEWFGKINIKNNLVSFYVGTNVLKYVPGGFWHFVERFYFINAISNSQLAFYSTLVEPYFMVSASFLLASLGTMFSPIFFPLILPIFFLNKKFIFKILRISESLKTKISDYLKIKSSNYKLEQRIKLNSFFPFKAILFEMAFIIIKFIGFVVLFNTEYSIGKTDTLFLFVIFCLSWSIGLIVPTAPSGVGVFEACFLFLIGKNFPQNIVIVSLVYFRLISTLVDLILSLPFLMRKILKKV